MKHPLAVLCLLLALLTCAGCANAADPGTGREIVPGIPAKDTVTLVDLGATTCIPCKMMAPILEELKTTYQGRAEVIFLDVHERPEIAKPFGIMAIPTQVLYDRQGKEIFRHTGFLEKADLVALLDRTLAAK